MRKVKIWLVATVMACGTLVGLAGPASAGTCPIDRLITTGSCW